MCKACECGKTKGQPGYGKGKMMAKGVAAKKMFVKKITKKSKEK